MIGFITPFLFSYRTGHFLSSLANKALDRKGEPLPWYTYPAIDFLSSRDFKEKIILEFGAGQSTLWRAKRSKKVVSFEGDGDWYNRVKRSAPSNVDFHLVPTATPQTCLTEIRDTLRQNTHHSFDLIIIDGFWRFELCEVAKEVLEPTGAIIADDSNGYGFYDAFKGSREFKRADFWGNAPGVILERCTSIYFKDKSPLFDSAQPIPSSNYDGILRPS